MIDLAERGGIAVVTMRHGKANALDLEFCKALTDCFARLKDGSSQGIVLTSEGNIFSAGVDLLRALDEGPDYFRTFLPALHALYETLFFFPKPVVAAINGHAIAGGCVLACCADRRVMVRGQGRIGVTELLVGLPFPHLAFEIMRFATASHRFEEVMVGAATYPPQDGYERGLVNLLVEPGTLSERAQAEAEKMVAVSPPAFALTKRQSRKPVADAFACDGRMFEDAVTEIWTRPESFARVKSYVERTLKKG